DDNRQTPINSDSSTRTLGMVEELNASGEHTRLRAFERRYHDFDLARRITQEAAGTFRHWHERIHDRRLKEGRGASWGGSINAPADQNNEGQWEQGRDDREQRRKDCPHDGHRSDQQNQRQQGCRNDGTDDAEDQSKDKTDRKENEPEDDL